MQMSFSFFKPSFVSGATFNSLFSTQKDFYTKEAWH